MSTNSLSPSSDLVIDVDYHNDNMEVAIEDIFNAVAECGLAGGQSVVTPHSQPSNTAIFKFGALTKNISQSMPVEKPRMSVLDPRTKFKPSEFLSLNQGCSGTDVFVKTDINNDDRNYNIKRTVHNNIKTEMTTCFNQGHKLPQESNGPASSNIAQPDFSKSEYQLESPTFSPPTSPITIGDADSQGQDLSMYLRMKQDQEAKMEAEKNKMIQIEKLIEQKKLKQQMQQQSFRIDHKPFYDPEIRAKEMELIEQELELKKQTTRMLQMQQNMLMKNNADDERRKLEDKEGILELQVQVRNLEMLLANKQVQEGIDIDRPKFKKPVKDRLGIRRVSVKANHENWSKGWREERKRRFSEKKGDSDRFALNKYKKYTNAKLPDDLVLTEITDNGPVKKEDLNNVSEGSKFHAKEEVEDYEEDLDRYELEGEMDPELILTEFGENGPVKAKKTALD